MSDCMSVGPSLRMEHLDSHWKEMEFDALGFFENLSRKFKF